MGKTKEGGNNAFVRISLAAHEDEVLEGVREARVILCFRREGNVAVHDGAHDIISEVNLLNKTTSVEVQGIMPIPRMTENSEENRFKGQLKKRTAEFLE